MIKYPALNFKGIVSLHKQSLFICQSKLFEGLDDDVGLSPDTFVPRKSIKKLVFKKKDGVDQVCSNTVFLLQRLTITQQREGYS